MYHDKYYDGTQKDGSEGDDSKCCQNSTQKCQDRSRCQESGKTKGKETANGKAAPKTWMRADGTGFGGPKIADGGQPSATKPKAKKALPKKKREQMITMTAEEAANGIILSGSDSPVYGELPAASKPKAKTSKSKSNAAPKASSDEHEGVEHAYEYLLVPRPL